MDHHYTKVNCNRKVDHGTILSGCNVQVTAIKICSIEYCKIGMSRHERNGWRVWKAFQLSLVQ